MLEYWFIGRRREIQHGTKVLRGEKDKYGLLIRGPAGLGKSCLAGKLIERFHKKSLVVFHGEVRAADIVSKLKRLFEVKNTRSGIDILGSDREYEEKIKVLFHTTLKELPTVLYFDDFEQNLIRHGDIHQIKPEALEVLKPLFSGFDLYKSFALEIDESDQFKGLTNLLITSRYPFVMEVDGSDLAAETLEDIPLMSLNDADLIKKENELPNIKKSKRRRIYLKYGKGNPRLLEWLEKIAGEEEKKEMHRIAFQWYDITIEINQTSDYRYLKEAVDHALESNILIHYRNRTKCYAMKQTLRIRAFVLLPDHTCLRAERRQVHGIWTFDVNVGRE